MNPFPCANIPYQTSRAQTRNSSREGLTPISTHHPLPQPPPPPPPHPLPLPVSAARSSFSPTNLNFNQAAIAAANRQGTSRHSSISSTSSFISPSSLATGAGPSTLGPRSRNVTASGNSLTSLSSATGSAPGAGSRLAKHSPSLSLSTSAGSPTSSGGPHSTGGSSAQLTSLVVSQLNILLSTIKPDTDRSKWEVQADKIRKLVGESGMEVFTQHFRRLLQINASTVFRGAPMENPGNYQLLVEEVQKITKDPQQADKIAQSLDTSEGELFRDFDLSTFFEHFRLDEFARFALLLACKATSKTELRAKADALLINHFSSFLNALTSHQNDDPDIELPPSVLATIVSRLIQDPPRTWGDERRESLLFAIRLRYHNSRLRTPTIVESAMYLEELLSSQDSRLAKVVQRTGPRGTASIDACKEMLAGVETRDISYNQIAGALLFMILAQNGDAYDPSTFVEGLRQHRAGSKVDWTDVVQGFDKENLRVTKEQFLALYNALLPLARAYENFDIQTLWGGNNWQHPETQLSFVIAFLTTTPEELDVMQIPNLRQAFDLTEFATATDDIRAFAEQAIKHPLVSKDATEALFAIVFSSHEAYAVAQSIRVPEQVINPNMAIFVCAASTVPKQWQPLQEQALKQLFHPFFQKQHPHYDFVLHSLWQHDKNWVAMRMVEWYTTDQMLLSLIYDHAMRHGWLESMLSIPTIFAVDLATYAHGRGQCNLHEWSQQHLNSVGPHTFARALLDFLRGKLEDEMAVQRGDGRNPTTCKLSIGTVYAILSLMIEALPDENLGGFYRQCLQTYPRLFNYGDDEAINAIIDDNAIGASNALRDVATREMEERYKEMYGGSTNPENLVNDLKRLKASHDPREQELFAAMLFGLFEEYNCFGEYPNEALATTAVLFGGLVSHHVLSGVAEHAALFMIFEAVSEQGPDDQMYRFGLQALIHVLPRLKEWPHLATRILQTPSLRDTQAVEAAENTLKELQQEHAGINGEGTNGITNGVVEDEFPIDDIPAFTAVQADSPLREDFYEDPNEDISDKVMFVLNNVSKRNLEDKFREIDEALEDKYHQWFAHYLVDELAKSQPNFQSLYLNVLEKFDKKMLWAEVLRETYKSCQKMLNAQTTMDTPNERTLLKNLATWLGSITLARNQPILHRNLSFKDLLIEGYDTQRLLVVIPFTCKTLVLASQSKVFRPPNPWMMELLGLLSELYHSVDIKLNLKFEIEVLCRDLNMDLKTIEPLDLIRSRPLLDQSLIPQYLPEGGPDAFGDMALMGLSKRGPNERFSPDDVIQAVPDLGTMLQIPPAAGNITQQQLRTIFVNAAQQAIYEIIAPVVERSVTIASISTSELVQKDFITEGDESSMRNSAHTVVKALSGSLALVTCKEPLRMSITNNIRILAARSLPEQLPEGQILMFVNDNIDTVCSLVERAAEDYSLNEIDLQMQQALEERRQHNEQRPNEAFAHEPPSRWATLIPDPYRQSMNGLNGQQLALYEDFGRQARISPLSHANNASQDSGRQIADVLSDTYLPSLPTPAEAPALPRQSQQRLPNMPPPQGQPQVNGYIDGSNITQRIVELMQELQAASREATEMHVSEIGEGSAIRRVYSQLVAMIESTPQADQLAALAGQSCLILIYSPEPTKRLEVEVFARLLVQLCRMSGPAGRQLTLSIVSADDDRMFNAVATISLYAERLMDLQHIDHLAAKALNARRPIVLPFLRDVLEELVLGEDPAFRTDFMLTYEALGQWLTEDPDLELGREIITLLQESGHQVNGMPSPESDITKNDQQEYIFEEWLRLQQKDVPLRSHLAFVTQLHERHAASVGEEPTVFFRVATEISYAEFERASSIPYASQDQASVAVDALAKLIVLLVAYQRPEETQTGKAKSLGSILAIVVLVMQEHHNKHAERWNSRAFFRLFSTLFCELREHRQALTEQEHHGVKQQLRLVLLTIQPRYFSGFLHGWLGLVSHRLLVPEFLDGGRINDGWNMFAELLTALFTTLGDLFAMGDAQHTAQDFYRGVLRFFTMLHHDFPDFLVENHMQLNACIPMQCVQLQNIVNSAVTRSVFNDQPDPFTPGMKINRLEQVRQAPTVHSDVPNVLERAGIRSIVDRVFAGTELSEQDFHYMLLIVDRQDGRISPILINALVLYVGMSATAASSVFSSAAAPARLLERLLRESRPEARYHLISAIANQIRYVNAHTQYFSTALQHMFGTGSQEQQEQIMRVLCERLMVPRPHPWGIIVMMLEMVKNPTYDIWSLPWMKTAPQVESMLMNLANSQENRMMRSPLTGFM